MKSYPTGWYGESSEPDQHTSSILLVLYEAGKSISFKEAGIQINELVKFKEMVK